MSENNTAIKSSLEQRVAEILRELCITPELLGYKYLKKALMLCATNPDTIDGITKVLYPTVAKQYDTEASRVERAIRHAIEKSFKFCHSETLSQFINPAAYVDRPTNGQFIAAITEVLRMEGYGNEQI
jgi:two-component system response regulator (stage 0 sporulation protein A)